MSGHRTDSDTDHSSQRELSSDATLEALFMDSDSSDDSDPSMDVMVTDSCSSDSSSDFMAIDIDSDDSSIQIIEPPTPEIVDLVSEDSDLVSDDSDYTELLDLDTDSYPSLPELTSVPPMTHSVTVPAPTIPEPVQEGEEPNIPELLSQFEHTPYPYTHDIPRVMDHYQFETLVSATAVDTPVPPPASTTPPPVSITFVPPSTIPVHTPIQTSDPSPVPVTTFAGGDYVPSLIIRLGFSSMLRWESQLLALVLVFRGLRIP